MEEKARICIKCNELKSIEDFPIYTIKNKDKSYTYRRKHCKTCDNKKRDDRRFRNGENINRIENHHNRSRKNILKKYNLTDKEYTSLVYNQGNRCAICRKPAEGKTLHIDHNHKTGKVRGLLCANCNILLGHCKESIEILQEAIGYLSKGKFEI